MAAIWCQAAGPAPDSCCCWQMQTGWPPGMPAALGSAHPAHASLSATPGPVPRRLQAARAVHHSSPEARAWRHVRIRCTCATRG
jgi:hypothetical protein